MGFDTHVTSRTGEGLAFPVRNVLLRLGIEVMLSHTKIHKINRVGVDRSLPTKEEVLRLDVAVDEILLVDGLNSRQLRPT